MSATKECVELDFNSMSDRASLWLVSRGLEPRPAAALLSRLQMFRQRASDIVESSVLVMLEGSEPNQLPRLTAYIALDGEIEMGRNNPKFLEAKPLLSDMFAQTVKPIPVGLTLDLYLDDFWDTVPAPRLFTILGMSAEEEIDTHEIATTLSRAFTQ